MNVTTSPRDGQQTRDGYLVASAGRTVYVRALGLASMRNATALDLFLAATIEAGSHTACIDLSGCTGMDSTFMGMLVGYGDAFQTAGGKLVIIRPSERGVHLLRMLGIFEILPVVEQCGLPELEFVSLATDPEISPPQRVELVRRAHLSLAGLNEANQVRFAGFLAALEADLAKRATADAG